MAKKFIINSAMLSRASFSRGRKMMWGFSLHGWENMMIGMLFAAGLFAVLVGVSTYAVVRLQREEITASKDELERYKADASARTAGLEKDAASARLETEKLKSVVTWRTLSAEQNTAIELALAKKPGSLNLRWQDGDPEALFLAIQISQLFGKAGWQVAPGAFKPANAILFDVVVPPVGGTDADTMRAALSAGRIKYSAIAVPDGGASFNFSTINGAPYLYIGSRKPVLP